MMNTKRSLLIMLLLAMMISVVAQVNGNLQTIGGKRILHVWGTHSERGYAKGYLLPTSITQVFHNYVYQTFAMANPTHYNTLRGFYLTNFNVEDKYYQEAAAIISGIVDAGGNIYHIGLQRDLDAHDLLLANAIVDLSVYRYDVTGDDSLELGCASLSSWGIATEADSTLAGRLVITRMLDWNQNLSLINNPLVVVSHPSEPGEVKWISFAYPGLIGALSAISETGTAAFLNMGNFNTYNDLNDLHLVLFSIRNAVESPDYNLDGFSTPIDVFDAIAGRNHLAGTIIHAISDNPDYTGGIIIENNNLSPAVYRTQYQNSNLPADHLAATNHFRMLSFPACCDRYINIADSLFTNPFMSAKRQLSVMTGATGMAHNLMQIQYIPLNGEIRWLTATVHQPAYSTSALVLNANELFDFPVPTSDHHLQPFTANLSVFPNPLVSGRDLQLKSDFPISGVSLFNLRGQRIMHSTSRQPVDTFTLSAADLKQYPRGVYILRIRNREGNAVARKLMLMD